MLATLNEIFKSLAWYLLWILSNAKSCINCETDVISIIFIFLKVWWRRGRCSSSWNRFIEFLSFLCSFYFISAKAANNVDARSTFAQIPYNKGFRWSIRRLAHGVFHMRKKNHFYYYHILYVIFESHYTYGSCRWEKWDSIWVKHIWVFFMKKKQEFSTLIDVSSFSCTNELRAKSDSAREQSQWPI